MNSKFIKSFVATLAIFFAFAAQAVDVEYVDADGTVKSTYAEYVSGASTRQTWYGGGWYYVSGNITLSKGVNCQSGGYVSLILADGATLTIDNVDSYNAGITVTGTSKLTIYGQQKGTGKLVVTGGMSGAGIGGGMQANGSGITINGGTIMATGGQWAAGIGGGAQANGSGITINRGKVTATGGELADGIGNGDEGSGSSGISVSSNLVLKVGSSNPPTETIAHDSSTDVASSLSGKKYATVSAPVTVTGVTALQRYPWNGKVDIAYTASGVAAAAEEIDKVPALKVLAIDRSTTPWTTNIAVSSALFVGPLGVEALTDAAATSDGTHQIVWDMNAQGLTFASSNLVFAVLGEAKELGVQLWENGPYWAECNVGATKPEEYGYYFMWGDTVGCKRNATDDGWISVDDGTAVMFSDTSCPTHNKSYSQLQSSGYIDSLGNLVAAHDAATKYLGSSWRMPTYEDVSNLFVKCVNEFTNDWNSIGVPGIVVKGKGDYSNRSIFLPIPGYGYDSAFYNTGNNGIYWTSTTCPNSKYNSWGCYFVYGDHLRWHDSLSRYCGTSIRPLHSASGSGPMLLCGDESEKVGVDLAMGARVAAESETLTYSTDWFGGDSVQLAADGTTLEGAEALTGTGTFVWTPAKQGANVLTHTVVTGGVPVVLATIFNAPVEYTVPVYVDNVASNGIAYWTTNSCANYTVVTSADSQVTWGTAGKTNWYVVSGADVEIMGGVTCHGHVNLILCEGAKLTVYNDDETAGIKTDSDGSFAIYGQPDGDGSLEASGASDCAAIGGGSEEDGSNITINGGLIVAKVFGYSAAIGGGWKGNGSNIVINGGEVTTSYDVFNSGSGGNIGGGWKGNGSNIVINGGKVTVNASERFAAIGGGQGGNGSYIAINGGTILATSVKGDIIGCGVDSPTLAQGNSVSFAAKMFFNLVGTPQPMPATFDDMTIMTPEAQTVDRVLAGGITDWTAATTFALTNAVTAATTNIVVNGANVEFAGSLLSLTNDTGKLTLKVVPLVTVTADDIDNTTHKFYWDGKELTEPAQVPTNSTPVYVVYEASTGCLYADGTTVKTNQLNTAVNPTTIVGDLPDAPFLPEAMVTTNGVSKWCSDVYLACETALAARPVAATVTLLRDVEVTNTISIAEDDADVTFDLNDHVLSGAEMILDEYDNYDPIFRVGRCKAFTVVDNAANGTAKYFTTNEDGLWVITNEVTELVITGGVITAAKHCAIYEGDWIAATTKLTVRDITFVGNRSDYAAPAINISDCTGVVENVRFIGNICYDSVGNAGGAIGCGDYYFTGGNPKLTLMGCEIVSNQALHSSGGGIFIAASATLEMNNCRIAYNSAASIGGGIYCESDYDNNGTFVTLTMTDCVVASNQAYNSFGGGIGCYGATKLMMVDCLVCNNTAGVGGGIYKDDDISDGQDKFVLIGTTVTGNTASNRGAGVYYKNIGSCLAAGTMIMMADGSVKAVEDVAEGDLVKTFDHEGGSNAAARVYMAYKGEAKGMAFTLVFDSAAELSIVGCHDLLEQSSRKYVTITAANVDQYIGAKFYGEDGQWHTLTDVKTETVATEYYSLYSARCQNIYANGMLTVADDVDYMLNLYELDENLKADAVQLEADIAEFGLLKITDIAEFEGMDETFDACNSKYIRIAIGKGLVTKSELWNLFNVTDYTEEKPAVVKAPKLMKLPKLAKSPMPSFDDFDTDVLTLGAGTTVTNNFANGAKSNIYLEEDSFIKLATDHSGISAGVTTLATPEAYAPVAFTTNGTMADVALFTSDSPCYEVRLLGSGLVLSVPDVTFTPEVLEFTEVTVYTNDAPVVAVSEGTYMIPSNATAHVVYKVVKGGYYFEDGITVVNNEITTSTDPATADAPNAPAPLQEVLPTDVDGTSYTIKTNGTLVATRGGKYMVYSNATVTVTYELDDEDYVFDNGLIAKDAVFNVDGTPGTPDDQLPGDPIRLWNVNSEFRYDVSYVTNDQGRAEYVIVHPSEMMPVAFSTNAWDEVDGKLVSVNVKSTEQSLDETFVNETNKNGCVDWTPTVGAFGFYDFKHIVTPNVLMAAPVTSSEALITYTTNFNLKVTQTKGGTVSVYTNGFDAANQVADDTWPLALVNDIGFISECESKLWSFRELLATNALGQKIALDYAVNATTNGFTMPVSNVYVAAAFDYIGVEIIPSAADNTYFNVYDDEGEVAASDGKYYVVTNSMVDVVYTASNGYFFADGTTVKTNTLCAINEPTETSCGPAYGPHNCHGTMFTVRIDSFAALTNFFEKGGNGYLVADVNVPEVAANQMSVKSASKLCLNGFKLGDYDGAYDDSSIIEAKESLEIVSCDCSARTERFWKREKTNDDRIFWTNVASLAEADYVTTGGVCSVKLDLGEGDLDDGVDIRVYDVNLVGAFNSAVTVFSQRGGYNVFSNCVIAGNAPASAYSPTFYICGDADIINCRFENNSGYADLYLGGAVGGLYDEEIKTNICRIIGSKLTGGGTTNGICNSFVVFDVFVEDSEISGHECGIEMGAGGRFIVGGTTVITNNVNANGEARNLIFYPEDSEMLVVSDTNPLTEGAMINVSYLAWDDGINGLVSTTGVFGVSNVVDYAQFFGADDPKYAVIYNENCELEVTGWVIFEFKDSADYKEEPWEVRNYELVKFVNYVREMNEIDELYDMTMDFVNEGELIGFTLPAGAHVGSWGGSYLIDFTNGTELVSHGAFTNGAWASFYGDGVMRLGDDTVLYVGVNDGWEYDTSVGVECDAVIDGKVTVGRRIGVVAAEYTEAELVFLGEVSFEGDGSLELLQNGKVSSVQRLDAANFTLPIGYVVFEYRDNSRFEDFGGVWTYVAKLCAAAELNVEGAIVTNTLEAALALSNNVRFISSDADMAAWLNQSRKVDDYQKLFVCAVTSPDGITYKVTAHLTDVATNEIIAACTKAAERIVKDSNARRIGAVEVETKAGIFYAVFSSDTADGTFVRDGEWTWGYGTKATLHFEPTTFREKRFYKVEANTKPE